MPIKHKYLHALALIIFAVISFFLTVGRVGTSFSKFALLTPDLGVYASFAAAQENPHLFVGDPLLSREENINSYNMLYYPIIKALKRLLGNYGTASIALLPITIFLHLAGFYLLGLVLFKKPEVAFVFTLLISASVEIVSLGGYWGLMLDPIPRFMYQSILPFALALALYYGQRTNLWLLLLLPIGVLNYVHPLSTVTLGLSVVLGLWFGLSSQPFWVKARSMALSVAVFVLFIAPFLITFFIGTEMGTETNDQYVQVVRIIKERYPVLAMQPEIRLYNFLSEGSISANPLWHIVWLVAIIGLLCGLLWPPNQEAESVFRTILGWMVGILISSVLIPIVEQKVFERLQFFSPEFELSKNLRYLVPVLLLTMYYSLWVFFNAFAQKFGLTKFSTTLFLMCGGVFFFAWGIIGGLQRSEIISAIRQNVNCFRQGKMICELPKKSQDFIDVLEAVQTHTPPGAKIFSEGQEVSIRYYALRPLVYSYKDGGPFAYTSHKQLLDWYDQYKQMTEIERMRRYPFRRNGFLKNLVKFARNQDAEYVILREPYQPELYYPPDLKVIYTNATYSLYSLMP